MTDIDPQASTDHSVAAGPPPRSFDRFLPVTAIAVMIGTFVTMNPFVAMSLIGAVWLIGTRISRSRRLLGFSLTEALAWAATIAIVEFLAIVILYLISNVLGN